MPIGIVCGPYIDMKLLMNDSASKPLGLIERFGWAAYLAGPPEFKPQPDIMKITKEICR